jgi:hypothetical protein
MSKSNDTFDFGAAVGADTDAYHPSQYEILPKGNWLCAIEEVENETSSGGFPMLKLVLDADEGRQWDNVVISPAEFSIAKLLGLIDATGVARPDPEKGEIDPKDGRLSTGYIGKLIGRKVGVIVRDEEDNREDHAGEWRPRVKGYITPEMLKTASTGALGSNSASSRGQSRQSTSESKLAF